MLKMGRPPAAGFTLVELMVVVAVLAILATLATPSMQTYIANQRIKSASFDLYSGLAFARTEAIKRSNGVVRMTPVGGNWAQGWAVAFFPSDGTAATALREHEAVGGIEISDSGAIAYLEYNHNGRPSSRMTLSLNVSGQSGIAGRCVSVDASGHPSTKLQPTGGC